MNASDWSAIWVTLQLALTTTLILLVVGTPIAWRLSRSKSQWKSVAEAIVALPLVLPPTVLGFYMLIALGPRGPIGGFLEKLGADHLAFSFEGLVFASVIYSMPFMVQPLLHGFSSIGKRPLEAAATLRASPRDTFFSVVVPMAKPAFLSAIALTFAHTIGEFGVVLMVGGNIPGATRVLSIAVYDHVDAMDYGRAHILSAGLLVASFIMLVVLYRLNRRQGAMLR